MTAARARRMPVVEWLTSACEGDVSRRTGTVHTSRRKVNRRAGLLDTALGLCPQPLGDRPGSTLSTVTTTRPTMAERAARPVVRTQRPARSGAKTPATGAFTASCLGRGAYLSPTASADAPHAVRPIRARKTTDIVGRLTSPMDM